jgi:hypothetical protein
MKIETLGKIAIVALLCVMMTGVASAVINVDLGSGTFELVPANNASASYDVAYRTDLGALEIASIIEGFDYAVSDMWYQNYSSFYLLEIDGITDDYMNSKAWFIYINDDLASYGLGLNTVQNNDMVKFMYCPYNTTTWLPYEDQAEENIQIKVRFV